MGQLPSPVSPTTCVLGSSKVRLEQKTPNELLPFSWHGERLPSEGGGDAAGVQSHRICSARLLVPSTEASGEPKNRHWINKCHLQKLWRASPALLPSGEGTEGVPLHLAARRRFHFMKNV